MRKSVLASVLLCAAVQSEVGIRQVYGGGNSGGTYTNADELLNGDPATLTLNG